MTETHRAVVLSDFSKPLEVKQLPIPIATSGSVVIEVLASHLVDYTKDILNGKLGYPLHFPLTPGGSCVGRVHSIGPDTTTLKQGQLVITDAIIAARDNASVQFLLGIHAGATPLTEPLSGKEWKNGSMAQLVKMPLENVYPLDEEVLLKEMGYAIVDLPLLQKLMIPYGGLADAGVSVGDTVIIAPATGGFGGAAVLTALSMGAKVVACGRNQQALEKLMIAMKNVSDGRLKSVAWTEDKDKDANLLKAAVGGRGADVYIDFSPPAAGAGGKTPAHMLQSISALKNGGTCVLMGGLTGSVTLPHMLLMINNITVRGKFMYERSQALQVIKMAEAGVLKLGSRVGYEIAQTFGLDNMDEALQEAEKLPGWGQSIAVVP